MRLARPLALTAVVAALTVAVAAPASAAPPALPDGDALYVGACDAVLPNLQLAEIDAATGAATPIGTGLADAPNCSYDVGFNHLDGLAYGMSDFIAGPGYQELYSIDPETGEIVVIGPLTTSDDVNGPMGSFTIGLDGVAYMIGYRGALATVDLETAEVTPVGTIAGMSGEDFWGAATDPVTGDLYVIGINGSLLRIDPVALTSELVASIPRPDGVTYLYGLTIDSAGTAWIVSSPAGTQDPGAASALWSTPLASPGALELSGSLALPGDPPTTFYSFVIFSAWSPPAPPAPQPQLAATGTDASGAAGWAVLAGVLLAAGAGIAVARRSRAA